MQKIVTNRCYGGFSLSHQAILRYAEIKGIKLYLEKDNGFTTYWTAPKDQRRGERRSEITLYDRSITRDDLALVQTVEELGEAADGGCAELGITEIPDGVEWEITEYDGLEYVAEAHRTW